MCGCVRGLGKPGPFFIPLPYIKIDIMSKDQGPDQATELTPEQVQAYKVQLLQSIQNEPSYYKIDVQDNTMLPDKIKDKKKLEFVIKPPTIHTLSRLAEIIEGIPEEVFKEKGLSATVLNHMPKITEMLAILMHGSSRKPMPEWYMPFLEKNVTTQETILLWQETAMKLDTSFFLPFIQSAKLMNPMTMLKTSESKRIIDSTRGGS